MTTTNLDIIITAKDLATQVLSSVGDSAQEAGGRAQGAMSSLAGYLQIGLVTAATAAGAAIIAIGTAGITANRDLQNASAKIQAFTKNSDETKNILAQVREEANKTPFAFNEMANSISSLLPVTKQTGKSIKELTTLSEILAASNPTEGLVGAAFSLREAASGDFTSVIDRFNLSRTTINKLKAEGVPAIDAITQALKEQGLDYELVTAQGKTFDGQLSTLQDNFSTFAGVLTQPIFDQLTQGISVLNTSFPTVSQVVQAAKAAFDSFLSSPVGQWIQAELIPPLMSLLAHLQPLIQSFASLWTLIGPTVIQILQVLGAVIGGVIILAIRSLIQIIDGAVQGVTIFINGLNWFIGVVQSVGNWIQWLSRTVSDFSNNALRMIFYFIDTASNAFWGFVNTVGGIFNNIGSAIGNGLKGGLNWVINLINGMVYGINDLLSAVRSLPGAGWVPSVSTIPMLATGGKVLSGGMAIVGERGPELVNLPGGSTVYSNAESQKAVGGGNTPINLTVNITTNGLESASARRDVIDMLSDELIRNVANNFNLSPSN